MKFKFIYTFFTLILCSVLFMASKDGRAFDQGRGNTGAPGDETDSGGNPRTCQSCHNNNANIQVSLEIEVLNNAGQSVTAYEPDATYDVKVTLVSSGSQTPSAYGFQLLSLDAPLNQNGNNRLAFANPSGNTRIAIASSNDRQYAEHKGPSNSNEFTVEWTAPEAGTGTITFYSCGNGVNANNETGGDNSDCTQLQLTEGDPTASKDLAEQVSLNVFPNPVNDVINLEFNSEVSGIFDLRVYNLYGQMVKADRINLNVGENKEFLDVNDLPEGNYLLQVIDGEQMTSRKIVKL